MGTKIMTLDDFPETCVNCGEFSNLEILEVTQSEGEPKVYECQCMNCLAVDVYQEDLDDFYQAMNDLRNDEWIGDEDLPEALKDAEE